MVVDRLAAVGRARARSTAFSPLHDVESADDEDVPASRRVYVAAFTRLDFSV